MTDDTLREIPPTLLMDGCVGCWLELRGTSLTASQDAFLCVCARPSDEGALSAVLRQRGYRAKQMMVCGSGLQTTTDRLPLCQTSQNSPIPSSDA